MLPRISRPTRWGLVLAAEGLVLILLGLLGLANAGWRASDDVPVLVVFELNTAHSVLLLVVGVLALIAAPWRRGVTVFAATQMVLGVLLFVYGTAESTADKSRTPFSLDPAENFLHAGLAVVGFIVLCAVASAPNSTRPRRLVAGR
jgi:peptidoglycan/LPS O-acetylase OafA/YrhL